MPKIAYTKPALTYMEQLEQLKNRGLIIKDEAKALHLLENISYYRLSGYWYPMLTTPKYLHRFKPRSHFNTAFKMYCFDRELRKLVLGELEKIEVAIRSKMIYTLSHKHGPFWYSNASLFRDREKLATSIKKLRDENRRCDEQFVRAFNEKYSDPLPPSWMILEVSSFGNLSGVYSNLKPGRDKRSIANYFGLDDSTFKSWLHSFTYIRNTCAHHARLWNRKMSISPQRPLSPIYPFISVTSNNSSLYFLLSMIIYLLNIINPGHTFKTKLNKLLSKYRMIDLKAMGVPDDWTEEELWK